MLNQKLIKTQSSGEHKEARKKKKTLSDIKL